MKLINKRILITGGYGLAGLALYNKLSDIGCNSLFRYSSKEFDLTDPSAANKIITCCSPDFVFHMAADVKGVLANKKTPASIYANNIKINTNILEACAKNQIEKLCLTSSGCAYPEEAPLPLKETDLWAGLPEKHTRIYGLVKRMLSIQSEAYYKEYGLNSITIIPTNLYGPGGTFNREHSPVIPGIISKIYKAKENYSESVTLWGDGSPTRDFIYIEDFANITIKLMQEYNSTAPVNVATGVERKISTIATLIKKLIGFEGDIIWDSSKPNGQQRRCFDISHLKDTIGEYQFFSMIKGLQQTIEWYKNSKELI